MERFDPASSRGSTVARGCAVLAKYVRLMKEFVNNDNEAMWCLS